jgi:hypothetical protein
MSVLAFALLILLAILVVGLGQVQRAEPHWSSR